MDDTEVCQLDLIKNSSLIMKAELEGVPPLLKVSWAEAQRAATTAAVKKSIPTRLLPVKTGCLVILNKLRTQINTLNDLEISVPTRVFAQSLLKLHLKRNATKTWNHYKWESFGPGGGKLQGTEHRLNKP